MIKLSPDDRLNPGKTFFLVLGLAVLTRVVYFWHFQDNPFFNYFYPGTDSTYYNEGARNFLAGDWLARGTLNKPSPVYKYFVALIYGFSGLRLQAVWFVQGILGALTTGLIFLAGRRLFGTASGFASAMIYNFYGPALIYDGILLRASLLTFLGVLSFYLLLRVADRPDRFNVVSAALAGSLFGQCRPNVLLVFMALAVLFLWKPEYRERRIILQLAGWAILFSVPLLVWGWLVHGKFVLFDASGSVTLPSANHPDYPGVRYRLDLNPGNYPSMTYGDIAADIISRWFRQPLDMTGLYLRKFFLFFYYYEYPSNNNYYQFRQFSFLLRNPLGNFAVVGGLGLLGAILFARDFRRLRPLYGFTLGMMLSVVLVYNVGRLRVPGVPYFALFAGAAAIRMGLWLAEKKFRPAALAGITFVYLLFLFGNDVDPTARPDENFSARTGHAYLNAGRLDEAETALAEAVRFQPHNFYAHIDMGRLVSARGEYKRALEHYREALRIQPASGEAHYRVALNLEKMNQGSVALSHMEEAVRLNKSNRIMSRDGAGPLDPVVEINRLRNKIGPEKIPDWRQSAGIFSIRRPKVFELEKYFIETLEEAEGGLASAQHRVGEMYAQGRGVEKNQELALKWHSRAARQNYAPSWFALGQIHEHGNGVKADKALAMEWYEKAAQAGMVTAQFRLGQALLNGDGAERDPEKGADWIHKAAEQGLAFAQVLLARLFETGNGVAQGDAGAEKWRRKAAATGNARAKFELAKMILEDKSEGSEQEARNLLSEAADQGFPAARRALQKFDRIKSRNRLAWVSTFYFIVLIAIKSADRFTQKENQIRSS